MTAWTYAKKQLPDTEPTNDKEKALRKFVNNWTCDEFVGFVDDCERVVDGLEIDPESDIGKQAEEVSHELSWALFPRRRRAG